ncbi:hypothetical protein Tsubulata_038350 [Turnera subulata]|uniref:Agglutinin domain-containing protein n=1 Tax=Turnera subulata TaxID=218843 RepID=A0A9Q0FE69_9ROSI|nr:hypothetical protein Tsubulata_038350 [Turnera subulata]
MSILPRFIALKGLQSIDYNSNKFLSYDNDVNSETYGLLQFSGDDAFGPAVKFEVERAENYPGKVSLKCWSNNKYLFCSESDKLQRTVITAAGDKPVENPSSDSCTLFEFRLESGSASDPLPKYRIWHHGRRLFVVSGHPRPGSNDWYLFLGSSETLTPPDDDDSDLNVLDLFTLVVVDLESVAKLPKYVAFKDDRGKYLAGCVIGGSKCLKFSGMKKTDRDVVHEILPVRDGSIRIKCVIFDDEWTRDTEIYDMLYDIHHPKPFWIWPSSSAARFGHYDQATLASLFWPVQIDDTKIALCCLLGRKYCSRKSSEAMEDGIAAEEDTINDSSLLEVEELVYKRHIYEVKYRLMYAKRYDERIVIVGSADAANTSKEKAHLDVKLGIRKTQTSAWKTGGSLKVGVKASIEVKSIPLIMDNKLETSTEVQGTFEYGKTHTEDYTSETTYKVEVPAGHRVIVNAKAKEGKIDVPFTYLQRDRIYSGKDEIGDGSDGVYTGVNYYEFSYEHAYEELPFHD